MRHQGAVCWLRKELSCPWNPKANRSWKFQLSNLDKQKKFYSPQKCELSHVARIVLFSTNRWRFDGEISKWRFWCKYVYCSVINNISWYCNKNFKNATEFTLCFVLLFITIDDFLIDSPHVFTNFSHWYFSISWDIYVKFWSFSHVQSWKEKAFSVFTHKILFLF